MALRLYFDEDSLHAAVLTPLREHGISLLTAQEAGLLAASDEEQLAFAASEGRVLVTHNIRDFYRLHTEWLETGRHHTGMILMQQDRFSVGERISRLLRIDVESTSEAMRDRAEFLSSWG